MLPPHPLIRLLRRALLVLLPVGGAAASVPPALPVIPPAVFVVTANGAVGDGATDNTTAIQATLNAAKAAGGGTVEVPTAALPYRCGPITVYGNTNLQLDAGATLQALPYGTYPNSNTAPAHFINIATGATNVAITGPGTIDGNGAAWWTAYSARVISNRPRLVQINHVDRMLVSGVTLLNSPMFHLAFSASNNVTIDGVTITAPSSSPNTDGIDPAGQHYLIRNCSISVGDDNIAVKPGSSFCGDIVVTNCNFGTGHGVSIGGQTNVGLDGMTVDSCTFQGTTTGLRMKADPTQGGPVQNVTYSNLTMTDVQYPFVFYSYYADVGSPGAVSGSSQTTPAKVAAWNAAPPDSLKSTTLPTWKNITVSHLTATGATGYSIIWGLPLAPGVIANVTLDDVRVSGAAGLGLYNAANVQFTGHTAFTVPAGATALSTYNALAITMQPQSRTVPPGTAVTFNVGVAGTSGVTNAAPGFQWLFNGVPLTDGPQADGALIAGANSATLTIANVQPGDAGTYAARVTNALDTYNPAAGTLTPSAAPFTATSAGATLDVAAPVASGLVNLSVRSAAGTGDRTLTVGFVVAGYGKPVLVRAVGPTLVQYGLTADVVLPDPQLALRDASSLVAANDNWGSAATAPDLAATAAAVGAFALPDGSADAALLATVDNGAYTAQVTGTGGVALAEIYDAAPLAGARLVNVSARTVAGAAENTLIAGFVIEGSAPRKLLLRAVGPSLAPFGVAGVLADPQLTVLTQAGAQVGFNNDWGSAATAPGTVAAERQAGAFTLPDGSKDAALVLTLAPGAYTAQVSAASGTSGVVLVEVYDVP